MSTFSLPPELCQAVTSGNWVPVLGPRTLEGVTDAQGNPIPADSDSLILAMNNGRPMAPKLMYEFPRAAMNIELKKGRKAVTRFLDTTYRDTRWSESTLHRQLVALQPDYILDLNRDTQLQTLWANTPHLLVVGLARIAGTGGRYRIFQQTGSGYQPVEEADADTRLPVLFKPLGTPLPESLYIASDADYVDYLTELMGGFGMPTFLKEKRQQRQYLLLGVDLNRDTPRMLLNDILYAAASPAGWITRHNTSTKAEKFLDKHRIETLPLEHLACLQALQQAIG